MATKNPLSALPRLRAQISPPCSSSQQVRHASLLKRPHRPYQFTQLVTLSDGSTYTQRTTSPQPIHISTKDTRNHPLWQPSMSSLRNIEEDEAGRLRAFRNRFGRGWDASSSSDASSSGEDGEGDGQDSLMDLISGSGDGAVKTKEAGEGGKKGKEDVEMITVRRDGVLMKVPALSRGERRGKS